MWYWVAAKPSESSLQVTDERRWGFIDEVKTLKGVEKRLSKMKQAGFVDKGEEEPSRIEIYTCVDPNYPSSFRKIKEIAL